MMFWTRVNLVAVVAAAVVGGGSGLPVLKGAGGDKPAAPSPAEGYDAECVKIEVPEKVLTDETFLARITMKNTGTRSWGPESSKHAYLRSQEPLDNNTWCCNFVIQGQGTNALPGTEFTYKSYLKAPSEPGEYVFRWRLARGNSFEEPRGPMFGEMTPRQVVTVQQRPPEPKEPPRPQESLGKRLLGAADFEYLGSFGLPEVAGCGPVFSTAGLAVRKLPDGGRRLFVHYTHPGTNVLFEIEIPELVKLELGKSADNHGFRGLQTAKVTKVWGQLGTAWKHYKEYEANGGICWDDSRKTMYWTANHPYWCGPPWSFPSLGASKLEDDGKVTNYGPWYVPHCKSYWAGVTRLPKEFADKYTGGRRLGLGWGGAFSGAATGSRGPALAAVAPPDLEDLKPTPEVSDPDEKKEELKVVEMLGYYQGGKAPRDGDYLVSTGSEFGYWGEPADSPTKGYFTQGDGVGSGVFVDLPEQHCYLAFVRLWVGRKGYDYGDSVAHTGDRRPDAKHCWYFYDPKDLAEAALGQRSINLTPYARDNVVIPGEPYHCAGFVDACFDEEKRTLYVYAMPKLSYNVAVHAYRVIASRTTRKPTP